MNIRQNKCDKQQTANDYEDMIQNDWRNCKMNEQTNKKFAKKKIVVLNCIISQDSAVLCARSVISHEFDIMNGFCFAL